MKITNAFLSLSIILSVVIVGCNSNTSKQETQESSAIDNAYKLVDNWPNFPIDFILGTPAGLGINSKNNVIVFHRAGRVWKGQIPETKIEENTILILNGQTGEIIDSWGKNLFFIPHGLEVDKDDNIWVTDAASHQIFKFSSYGNLLLTLGEAKVPGDDSTHFNRPTDIAVSKDGSFYVSDGYGNSRIVKFSADGSFLFQWGSKGDESGQFVIPHGIDLDNNGNVYVADRENNRIQIFNGKGKFLREWQNTGTDQLYSVNVDEERGHLFGIDYLVVSDTIIKGSDIFRFDLETNLQVQFGRTGNYEGPITRYHDIAVDMDGSVYLGDILGNRIQKFELVTKSK